MNTKQRRTLNRIFMQPTPAEIAWSDVESLLRALGATITEGAGSRVRMTLGKVNRNLHVPHPKRICTYMMIRDIRDFLIYAGVEV